MDTTIPAEITPTSTLEERKAYKEWVARTAEENGANHGHERREVQLRGAIAKAFMRPDLMVLMDPEDPKVDVNELYQRRGRQMLDPALMNFGCPLCKREMAYELFVQHAEPCMRKWYKTLDPTRRRFAGPQEPKSTTIIGAVASADSVAKVQGE